MMPSPVAPSLTGPSLLAEQGLLVDGRAAAATTAAASAPVPTSRRAPPRVPVAPRPRPAPRPPISTIGRPRPSRPGTPKLPPQWAFLSDPRLSVEEKLMRFMAMLAKDYDKKITDLMEKRAGKAGQNAASGTAGTAGAAAPRKKKSKGLLGGVLRKLGSGVVGKALKQLAGPALAAAATAFGMPQLAPLMLKAGPQLTDLLFKAIDGVAARAQGGGQAGATASAAPSSGGASTAASSSSATSSAASSQEAGTDDSLLKMELQRLVEQQKEWFSLVSNMLRTNHDMRMAAVNNIR